jgi:hypothetical protein
VGKKFPGKNARRKRNMKNGIKMTARLVKQLAEALDGVKDLALLSDEEIAELLDRSEVFENWTEEMREEALGLILQGRIIPGYKATSANTKRKFRNEKAAATLIQEAGFDPWDRKIKSIPTLETLMGKEKFDEVCGALVVKPEGKMKLERADRRRG